MREMRKQVYIRVLKFGPLVAVLTGVAMAAILLVLFLHARDFNFFVSDVAGYWQDRLSIAVPFNRSHIAGYPFILALVDTITFQAFSPVVVMIAVTIMSTLISCAILWELTTGIRSTKIRLFVVCMFACWPLTGLSYVVYPVADSVAMTFLLLAWYSFNHRHLLLMVIALSAALLMHKMMWVIVPLVWGGYLLTAQVDTPIKRLSYSALVVFPLGLLWFAGTLHHGDAMWMFTTSVVVETAIDTGIPFLGGVLTTIRDEHVAGSVKVLVCFLPVAVSIYVMLQSFQKRVVLPFNAGIAISLILLFFFVSENTLWSVARFGKLAAPASLVASGDLSKLEIPYWVLVGVSLSLYLSQFVFANYMADYFH